jgi:hypothetical protein
MSKKIGLSVCESTKNLIFSSENNLILMNAFRYNTNIFPRDHVLIFITDLVFRELELAIML